jgi:hypothetical protein
MDHHSAFNCTFHTSYIAVWCLVLRDKRQATSTSKRVARLLSYSGEKHPGFAPTANGPIQRTKPHIHIPQLHHT